MKEDEVVLKVHDMIGELAPDAEAEVTPETRLVEDLGYHSLALLELSVSLEDTFGLPPLDAEATSGIGNVGDITRLVRQMLADAGER
jgi:acyl carrier protein